MPLYAFDGTWNRDEIDEARDTNVCRLYQASTEPVGRKLYVQGVGTKLGILGKFIGGVTGAGGWGRVHDAMRHLEHNWSGEPVDVVGFSRGSALALDFVNEIAKGIRPTVGPSAGALIVPRLRFLGLWDLVASFGVPGNNVNLGYQLTVPQMVEHCYHAMALDERRYTFGLTRVKYAEDKKRPDGAKRAYEVWFRGGHSDVGGGNQNPERSNIALRWIMLKAIRHGVLLDRTKVPPALPDNSDPPVKGKQWVIRWKRNPAANERVHHTVERSLGKGFNDPPPPFLVEPD